MRQPLILLIPAVVALLATGCQKSVEPTQLLKNDLLKKTVGPAVVGDRIEFAYAIGTLEGDLKNVRAEATVAGGPGTGFSRNSWYNQLLHRR